MDFSMVEFISEESSEIILPSYETVPLGENILNRFLKHEICLITGKNGFPLPLLVGSVPSIPDTKCA